MMLCQTSVNNIYCAMEIFFLEEKKKNCKPGRNRFAVNEENTLKVWYRTNEEK